MTKFNCECVNQGFMQNKPWDKCDKCNGTGVKGSPRKQEIPGDNYASSNVISPFSEPLPDSIYNKYLAQQNERKSCVVVPDSMEFVPMEKFPEITANRMHLVCTKHSESMRIFDRYIHKRPRAGSQQMVIHLLSQCDPLTSLRGCVGDVVFTFTPDEKLLNMAKMVTMGKHKIYRLEDNYHLSKADL